MSTALTATTLQMAEILGVTDRSLQNYAKAGCPKEKHGTWIVKDVVAWFLDNVYESSRGEDGAPDSLGEAKRKYWWEKAAGEELKNEQSRGLLVAWVDIEREWMGRLAELVNGLQAFVDRLPPLLEGKSRLEIRRIIDDEVRNLRSAYAREGTYCPKHSPRKASTGSTSTKKRA